MGSAFVGFGALLAIAAPLPALSQSIAKPTVGLEQLFEADDYPAAALRAGEEGRVVMRLKIDRMGRLMACDVQTSSGSEALDAISCQKMHLAQFEPARDGKGRAIDGSFSVPVLWRLPVEEPTSKSDTAKRSPPQ